MSKTRPMQNQFNGGEWSELMEGRDDLEKYNSSCRVLQNMLGLVQGPAERRTGWEFINAAPDHTKKGRVIGFVFGTIQAYMLYLGDLVMRFYMNGGMIVTDAVSTTIANGTFDSDISGWTDVSTGGTAAISHDSTDKRLAIAGAGTEFGAAQLALSIDPADDETLHVVRFRNDGLPGDPLTVRAGTTSGGQELVKDRACEPGDHTVSFTPGTGVTTVYLEFRHKKDIAVHLDDVEILSDQALELPTPWPVDDVFKVRRTQSVDVFYATCRGYWQRKISRYGHYDWSLARIDFIDGPYLVENPTATTLTPAATSGTDVTVTASSTEGINKGQGFVATDVGRPIRIKHSSTWGWGRIRSVTSATVVKLDVREALGGTAAVAAWRLGAWSEETGYPTDATFDKERLVYYGIEVGRPERADGSAVGDFETFRPGTADADAISFNVVADEVQVPRWIRSFKGLICGTSSGEARVTGETERAQLTPVNANVEFQTNHGSADLAPLRAEKSLLYVERGGNVVRAHEFSIQDEGMVSPDMTQLADHIVAVGIADWTWQMKPWSQVWACLTDGSLVSSTFRRPEDVVGWQRQPHGATKAGKAEVESLDTIPGAVDDELWCTVKLTLDAGVRRYVQRLGPRWGRTAALEDAFFVDCGVTKSAGTPFTAVDVPHLEGETVHILADGAVSPPQTVPAGGQITLPRAASKVHVGLACPWRLKPQKPAYGGRTGSPRGKPVKRSGASLLLFRSLGVKAGTREDNLEPIIFREQGTAKMGEPLEPFTGLKDVPLTGGWGDGGDILFGGDEPLPSTLLAVVYDQLTNDG